MTSSHPTPVPCQWFARLASSLDRRSAPRLALLFFGAVLARGRRTVTLLWQSDKLFDAWHKVRDGTIQRSTFLQTVAWLRPMVRSSLERGAVCACPKTATTCGELLRLWDCLWTFTRVEGVEPTNDAAEPALRHAAIWRRISSGTDSEVGGRFVERLLTVVATCRQRGHDVLGYLTTCLRARFDGPPAPPLLA